MSSPQQRRTLGNDAAADLFRVIADSAADRSRTARRMLSVIIATKDSERALVPTLAALVSGATAGMISEVLIADGGSRDDTAAVAEVAGCNFFVFDGTTARRLHPAARKSTRARAFVPAPGNPARCAVDRRRTPLRRAAHAAGQRCRIPPRRAD